MPRAARESAAPLNDPATFKTSILSALKWVASMRLLGQLASWVATLVVIRVLQPADYGVAALAQLLVGLATLINEIGLIPALIQTSTVSKDLTRSVAGYVLLSNFILYCAIYLCAPAFAHFYGNEELVDIVRVLAVQLLIGAVGSVPAALARRNLAFKGLSIINFSSTIAATLASLSLALCGAGVWSLVIASLLSTAVTSTAVICMTTERIRPSLRLAGMRKLMSYGIWFSGSRLIGYVAHSADDLLIGRLFDSHVLGYFSMAKNLAAMPMSRVMEIINQIMFPAYARLKSDPERIRYYFLRSVWLAMLLFCPVTWGLASVADVFTTVVLGAKWHEAVFALRMAALSIPIQAITYLLTPAVEALGRPDITFRNVSIRLVVFPTAILLAAPYGIEAVIIAFLLARIVATVLLLWNSAGVLGYSPTMLWKASWQALVAGAVMYGVVVLLTTTLRAQLGDVQTLLAAIVTGGLVFLGTLHLLAPETWSEVRATFRSR